MSYVEVCKYYYYSGDTAYFKDMETIGEQYEIDVALLNISGMGPRTSAKAAQVVRARLAIPHHFAPNADAFLNEV